MEMIIWMYILLEGLCYSWQCPWPQSRLDMITLNPILHMYEVYLKTQLFLLLCLPWLWDQPPCCMWLYTAHLDGRSLNFHLEYTRDSQIHVPVIFWWWHLTVWVLTGLCFCKLITLELWQIKSTILLCVLVHHFLQFLKYRSVWNLYLCMVSCFTLCHPHISHQTSGSHH